ncbi:MAG: hypothetical protein P1U44_03370 [Vicingaceae bacterium]|nr:hypothetical protein [Vicingaceae bacterium]
MKSNVTTRAIPVVRKYLVSVIQKEVISSNMSLSVSSPMAVTIPIMYYVPN